MPELRHAYKTVPLAQLRPWEKNARQHSPEQIEQLRKSIREFGFTNPVLVDAQFNVIAGHGRILAARAEGLEELPAIELRGLSETQKRALVVADNQLALNATWDDELLKLELGTLKSDGFDLNITGFTDKELKRLLSLSPGSGADDVPEPPKHPVTRTGDLWMLGRHRVLCGDSFEPYDVERLLQKHKANMVLTDPPYAIYGSSTGIAADIADDKMVRPFFEKLGRVLADNTLEFGHIYVHCDWRSYATLWHGLKSAQLAPKNCVVWDKGSSGLGNSYANTHEFVAFFAKLPKQKAMTSGNKRGQRPVHQANIYRANRVSGAEREHNAAKPVDLLAWLIGNSSEEGHLVLDLFGGSGSTLIAAHKEQRVCSMMEMEPGMVDVTVERYQRFAAEPALLEKDGRAFATVKEERHGHASHRPS
jgi:DNA modification methylase